MLKQAETLLISGNYADAMALCCELQLADDLHLRNESTLLVGVALAEYRCFAEIANALDALAQNRNLSFGLASMRMRSHIELNEISAASQIFRQLSDMARTAGEIGILVKAAPCIFECAALYHELGKLLSALERIAPPSALPLDAAIVRAGILLSLGNRAGFMNLVSQTRGMDPAAHEELDLMQQMAARLEAHQASGAATAKIFCIGLSKTATTSLNKALGLLGYLSAHWANPITGKLLDDEDIPLFDSLGDTPVSYRFEELYHSYPNARFIYSQRDPAPWEKSVTKHYAASHRDRQAQNFATLSRFNHHAQEISYGERARRLNNCVYFNDRSFVDAYRNFDRRVRRFFEDKPASCFLEVDIFSGDGWNMLCPFLEKPIPDTPFPWEYQTRLIIEGKS